MIAHPRLQRASAKRALDKAAACVRRLISRIRLWFWGALAIENVHVVRPFFPVAALILVCLVTMTACGKFPLPSNISIGGSNTYVSIGEFEPRDVHRIVQALEQEGIVANRDYQIFKDGRSIQVREDVRDAALSMLALRGILPAYNYEAFPLNNSIYSLAIHRMVNGRRAETRRIVLLDTQVADFQLTVGIPSSFSQGDSSHFTASSIVTYQTGCKPSDTQIRAVWLLIRNDFPFVSDSHLSLIVERGRQNE